MEKLYRGYTLRQISSAIDHSVLKPDHTSADVRLGAQTALKHSVASLCIRPGDVKIASEFLAGTPVELSTVIGFPHGTTTTETKVFESIQAVRGGCLELDMVLNVGALIEGNHDLVLSDIAEVVSAAKDTNPKVILKVIFETALLNDGQIVKACELSEAAGADYVKTSTGFASEGATVHHIELMKKCVGDRLGVKASGGIRDLDSLVDMLEAGATRVGSSATEAILADFLAKAE